MAAASASAPAWTCSSPSTAKDERTVEFRLKTPDATFFTLVLPNVMIDSKANVEAAYKPLADRAASLDPNAFDDLAQQIYDDLGSDAPKCGSTDAADELLTSAGLPTYPREQFALDGAPFDACLYSEFVAERLVGVAASLRTTGLDAISAAYHALAINQHPVGTGPFRFVRIEDGNRAVFDAFDGYHFGRPAAAGVDMLITHDTEVIAQGLESGAIDWAPLSKPLYRQFRDDPDLQLTEYPAEAYGLIGYNLRPGALFADQGSSVRIGVVHRQARDGRGRDERRRRRHLLADRSDLVGVPAGPETPRARRAGGQGTDRVGRLDAGGGWRLRPRWKAPISKHCHSQQSRNNGSGFSISWRRKSRIAASRSTRFEPIRTRFSARC